MRISYVFFLTLAGMTLSPSAAWSQWLYGPGSSIYNNNGGAVRVGATEEIGGNKFFVAGSVGIASSSSYTEKQLKLGYDLSTNRGYIYAYDIYGGYKDLVINSSGGNVGIRISSPTHPLTVGGAIRSTSGGFVLPDGTVVDSAADLGGLWYNGMTYITAPANVNVGIGATPQTKLHVAGDLRVTGHYDWYAGGNFRLQGAGEWSFDFPDGDGGDVWHVWDPVHSTILAARNNGWVGVGTGSPATGLDVRANSGRITGNALYFYGSGNASDGLPYARLEESYGMRFRSPDSRWVLSTSNSLLVGYQPSGISYGAGNLLVQGNVGVGTATPGVRLHVNGSVRGNQSGALRIDSGSGYVDIGAKNTGWAHFYTDRPAYYFDKEIRVDSGFIGTYNENLSLRTNGVTQMTIQMSNGHVGIGTPTPSHVLTVAGAIRSTSGGFVLPDGTIVDSSDDMGQWTVNGSNIYRNSGYIGLGTPAPQGALNVVGSIFLEHQAWGPNNAGLTFSDPDNRGEYATLYMHGADNSLRVGTYLGGWYDRMTVARNGNIGIGTAVPDERLEVIGKVKASEGFLLPDGTLLDSADDVGRWTPAGADIYRITGNVGIGTSNPQSMLAVNGIVTAKEIKVTQSGWADAVFEHDYPLMPLSMLERHIRTERHLPGIPTTTEVLAEGVKVGEMQVRLLQKVEELTLYIIALDKESHRLRQQVAGLQENIK